MVGGRPGVAVRCIQAGKAILKPLKPPPADEQFGPDKCMVSFTLTDDFACSTTRHNGRKEYLHMGDKGGKKDKAKSKQQHDAKQKAEVKRNEEKRPRKTS